MKKKLGRTPQNKPPFPRFFEKIGNTKNTFFPSWQKFRTSIFEKRPKIVDFWGPRPRIFFFFDKLSIKKLGHTKNFGRDPPHRHFRAYFRKNVFEIFIFFSYFFSGNYNQILFIFHKKSTFQRLSGEITKEI